MRRAAPKIASLLGDRIDLRLLLSLEASPALATEDQIAAVLEGLARVARRSLPEGGTVTLETWNPPAEARGVAPVTAPCVALGMSWRKRGPATEGTDVVFRAPFLMSQSEIRATPGLADAVAIVDALGGRIGVRVESGGSPRYEVILQTVDEPSTATPARAEPEPPIAPPTGHPGDAAILVVEDDEAVRRGILLNLEEAGYRAGSFANSGHVLEELSHADVQVRLLITDVEMPGTSGFELADRLACTHPDGRVLFLSGHDTTRLFDGREPPPLRHGVLQKPFRRADLLKAVSRLLD